MTNTVTDLQLGVATSFSNTNGCILSTGSITATLVPNFNEGFALLQIEQLDQCTGLQPFRAFTDARFPLDELKTNSTFTSATLRATFFVLNFACGGCEFEPVTFHLTFTATSTETRDNPKRDSPPARQG